LPSGLVGDVVGEELRLAAAGTQPRGQRLAGGAIDIGQHHRRALAHHQLGVGDPLAARAAGD
jgi:hypothetical protein